MKPSTQRNPNLELRSPELAPPGSLPPPDDALTGPRPGWWWTGREPRPLACPGVRADGVLTSLPPPDLSRCTRQEALDYFENTWALTEVLFAALQGEGAFYGPPYHQLRHPLVFYYAHPATFYVNKLRLAGLLAPMHEYYEMLFQTGVDEMSWDDLARAESSWPSIRALAEYRRAAFRAVRRVIETHPGLEYSHPPIGPDSPLWALFMSVEHERIHLELSSVLIRELPVEWVRPPAAWPPDHPSAAAGPSALLPQAGTDYPDNPLEPVRGGPVVFGKPHDSPSYGWDNEYGERHARVRPFRATKFLVTNGEFFEFVRAGSYRERGYWSDEGWKWRTFRNAKWPTFWVAAGPAGLDQYMLRTLFEVVEMPWRWPAEVNFHEAQAYCAWRRARDGSALPYRVLTEAEHHRLRGGPSPTPSGHPPTRAMNANLAFGSPSPVDAHPPEPSGFHDVFGNVWEWCEDHLYPLPGFRVHPYYDDFSTPCFDGKHQMILGGSFVSTGAEASAWARFHFRPHFFQHCGFRVGCADDGDPTCDAVSLAGATSAQNVYETRKLLDEYLMLHYGRPEDALPFPFGPADALGFPQRCARLVADAAARLGVGVDRALDVGCAVGGASFALARTFDAVLGLDLSAAFIGAADELKRAGRLAFTRRDEGELGEELVAAIDPDIDRGRVAFRQADACSLPAELVGFDAVLLANLLCRLPSPRACLERMGGPRGIVRPGGLLVVTSPYTWLEQFTPKEVWLGGIVRDGRAVRGLDGLRALLAGEFDLVEQHDLPLLIREHARKYQYIVAHATLWRRRP